MVAGDGEYRVDGGVVCGQDKCGTAAAYTRIKMQEEASQTTKEAQSQKTSEAPVIVSQMNPSKKGIQANRNSTNYLTTLSQGRTKSRRKQKLIRDIHRELSAT